LPSWLSLIIYLTRYFCFAVIAAARIKYIR